jgi:hypothetical protein
MISVNSAASAVASSTVSLSSEALHALEQFGKTTCEAVRSGVSGIVDEVGDLAVDAWHGLKTGAADIEHLAEVGWEDVKFAAAAVENFSESALETIESGAVSLASTASAVTKEAIDLGGSALSTTGDALSSAASSVVFLAGAGARAIGAVV